MRLLTFRADNGVNRLGLLVDEEVVDIQLLAQSQGADVPSDLLDLIGDRAALDLVRSLVTGADGRWPQGVATPLEAVTLAPPIRPGKIVGVGLNYTEHVAESARSLDTNKELPARPVLFSKPSTAVVGHGEPIRHDGDLTSQLDWEVELAVVIGKRSFRVSEDDAMDHVAGYTIMNDVSARDQRRSGQWFFSKGQDSYAPLGPWITTADDIPDPHDLDLELKVNGQTKQKSNTAFMLFSIRQLIADITSGMTLEVGDVIATGSPSGVGAAQTPPEYLRPGDVVELSVEKIGTLVNPVVDAR